MSHYQLALFCLFIVFLVALSGFFSMAETSLLSLNRYRLKHRARLKKRSAILILQLLKRPDRFLGMVLIGNCIANIVASALATLVAEHYWGETGVVLTTIVLTFVILVFAEVAPKTVAALHPDATARWVALPMKWSLALFYPVVWVVNTFVNSMLRIFDIKFNQKQLEALSRDELRSMVFDASGKAKRQYQSMILGVLDLNKVLVDDVMIPSHEISGIDIEQTWEEIQARLVASQHHWLPVYRNDVNHVIGILHSRDITALLLAGKTLNKEVILHHLHDPYFIPEGTALNTQLLNFQQKRKRIALVVDEYGEIHGLVSLEDILEEIVGDLTTNTLTPVKIRAEAGGTYLVDGDITIRDLNRALDWTLPSRGARTLNGLIIDYLEAMPIAHTCTMIDGFPLEIVEVKENRVTLARLYPPRLTGAEGSEI